MLNSAIQSAANQGKEKARANILKVSKKTKVKYVAIFSLLMVLPFFLFYFDLIDNASTFYLAIQFLAFLLGIIHLWQMSKKFGWTNQYSLKEKISLTLLIISIAFILQLITVYFCKEIHSLFIIFPTSILIFVFPLLAVTTFDYSYSIPKAIYKTWKYPTNINMPDLDMIDFSNSYIVTFEFKKNVGDFKNTTMKFKAPPDKLSFGDLFYLYLFEYNEKNREASIQIIDERNQTFQWLFHIKSDSWFGDKKYIDTALTVRENKIKENDIIIAERV